MNAETPREAAQERHSAETRISLRLNLDGDGTTRIRTGFGLLDHGFVGSNVDFNATVLGTAGGGVV